MHKLVTIKVFPEFYSEVDLSGSALSVEATTRSPSEVSTPVSVLKAAYGILQSQAGQQQQAGIGGDLTSWLPTARPKSYMVLAVRVMRRAPSVAVEAAEAAVEGTEGSAE